MANEYGRYRQETLRQTALITRFCRGFPTWWGTIADTIAIVTVAVTPFIVIHGYGFEVAFALITLSVVAATSLIAALYLHIRSRKAIAYSYAMASLHHAIHILRNEMANNSEWTDSEIKSCLAEVLGTVATAFTIIVNGPCRACVKVVTLIPPTGCAPDKIADGERIQHSYARTFCRDFATAEQIGHGDASQTEAPVEKNTAFRFLFDDVRVRYFLGNDLPNMMKCARYINTSIHKYQMAGDSTWSLPYKAAMVWPIRVVTDRALLQTGLFTGKQVIIGYLAVDTIVTNAFDPSVDFEVGALLADALYIFLTHVLTEREHNEGRESKQLRVDAKT